MCLKKNSSNERIFLAWAHSKSEPNFGDELGPYILHKVTGMKIIHIPVLNNRLHLLMLIIKRIITIKISEAYDFIKLFFGKKYYIFLGSIIQFYKINGGIVYGAGLIDNNYTTGNHKYYAVRGPRTKDLLEKKGYNVPEIFGDPALVLSKVYNKRVLVKNKIGIIPHIIHYENLLNHTLHDDIALINLKTSDIELVIDTIRSCEFIISSSLHGIIVAHAYGIPALWVNLSNRKLMGNNIKFYDYFDSLSIPIYDQIPINFNNLSNLEIITSLFDNCKQSLPKPENLNILIEKFINNAPPLLKKHLSNI